MNTRPLEERFWEKVNMAGANECWEWTAQTVGKGYGRFRIGRKMFLAHRVAWEIYNGPIPQGMCVCHHCDNPPCANPFHLFLGTHADNVADRDRKGRRVALKGMEQTNAKLTDNDVRAIRVAKGRKSQRELGRKYGVDHSIIGNIHRNERWTHVQ